MSGGWGTPSWMGGDPMPGETFVSDKSPESARLLLEAATALGLHPEVVRTTTAGFVVPDEVYEKARSIELDRTGRAF